jgi:hypothetical protein
MGSYAKRLQQRLNKTAPAVTDRSKKEFPADKGFWGGSCNMSACLRPGATWYNHGSLKYYCRSCAHDLNFDSFNRVESQRIWGPGKQMCEYQPTSEPLPKREWLAR